MPRKKEFIKVTAKQGKIHKIIDDGTKERFHVCITGPEFEQNPKKVYELPLCQASMDLVLKDRLFDLVSTENVTRINDLLSEVTKSTEDE